MSRALIGRARQILRHIGRRGFVLIIWGLVFLLAFVRYYSVPEPATGLQKDMQEVITAIIPLWMWAWVFLFAALLSFAGSVLKPRVEALAFGFSTLLWYTWGLGIAVTAIGSTHAVVILFTAVIYFGIGTKMLVTSGWQENDHGMAPLPRERDGRSDSRHTRWTRLRREQARSDADRESGDSEGGPDGL
jgi:hypothetical protein